MRDYKRNWHQKIIIRKANKKETTILSEVLISIPHKQLITLRGSFKV